MTEFDIELTVMDAYPLFSPVPKSIERLFYIDDSGETIEVEILSKHDGGNYGIRLGGKWIVVPPSTMLYGILETGERERKALTRKQQAIETTRQKYGIRETT